MLIVKKNVYFKEKQKLNIAYATGLSGPISNLLELKYDVNVLDVTKDIDEIDLLIFTGGADVSPSFYKEKVGKYTHVMTHRDVEERKIYREYTNTPKLGICRGAQFLTVMAGGKLIQHVGQHGISHLVEDKEGNVLSITSTHHQMMYPYEILADKFDLIAWSEEKRSETYLNGNNEEMPILPTFKEPEIVYYEGENSLAIQGHPEFVTCPEITKEYCLDLIGMLLEGSLK